MKLKYELENVEMDDQIIAVPVGDNSDELHAVIRLNETASFILDHLKEDTTEEKLIEAVLSEYEGDEKEIRKYVSDFIASLNKDGLLI